MHAHVRAVHGGGGARPPRASSQKHDCILCRKKFGTVAGLQSHLQTHAHQLALEDVDDIAVGSAESTGAELTYYNTEKQPDDVYVALPHAHFDDFDVS